MRKTIAILFILVVVTFFCFGISNEEFDEILKLILQSPSFSGLVIINQDIEDTVLSYYIQNLSLVVIGPNCHRLPANYFYGGTIENLILLSDDLTSTGSSNIFNCEITNNYANVPFFFVEEVVKRVLNLSNQSSSKPTQNEVTDKIIDETYALYTKMIENGYLEHVTDLAVDIVKDGYFKNQ